MCCLKLVKGKKRILIYIVDLFSNQADRTKGCGEWHQGGVLGKGEDSNSS